MRQDALPEDLTLRRAGSEDAGRIAELFALVYRNSSHPFRTIDDVSRFLLDRRNFLIVAERESRTVACAGMTYCPWNEAYEIGRAITHPDYRRLGLAATLMQRVVDWVCESALGDVFFGFARVGRIVDLGIALNPSFMPAGHDAGRNVANGSRETHLISYAIPGHARFRHLAPSTTVVARSMFVRKRIYAPLGLRWVAGDYPPHWLVGAISIQSEVFEDLVFECDRASPSQALEIVGHRAELKSPREIRRMLDRLLRSQTEVQHVTVTVLADKLNLMRELCELGFEIAAYLPAWYKEGESRYDCVQLTRRAYAEQPLVQGFEDILLSLQAELRSILVPAHARQTMPAALGAGD